MRFAICVSALMLNVFSAQAQSVVAADPEIEGTISGQLDAFRANDLDAAWRFASPAIQGLFETRERFGRMVEQGYPMVWSPGEPRFLELQEYNDFMVQRVEIPGTDGRAYLLEYQVIEVDGDWRINAVRLVDAEILGV